MKMKMRIDRAVPLIIVGGVNNLKRGPHIYVTWVPNAAEQRTLNPTRALLFYGPRRAHSWPLL
jgi:hypothetical protein